MTFLPFFVVMVKFDQSVRVSGLWRYFFLSRNYVIVASQILRPRVMYGVAVHAFDDSSAHEVHNRSYQFHVAITSDGNEILSHKETLYWNLPQLVSFPVRTMTRRICQWHPLGREPKEIHLLPLGFCFFLQALCWNIHEFLNFSSIYSNSTSFSNFF